MYAEVSAMAVQDTWSAMCRDLNQASAISLFQAVRCSRQEGREEPT